MDPHSEFEMEDMEEIAENMGRSKKQAGAGIPLRPVVTGLIVIIVLLVVFALFFRGGNGMSSEETAAILERLNRLEQKQQLYEEFVKNSGDVSTQLHSLENSITDLEGRNESQAEEIRKIGKQLALLSDKMVSAPKKAEAPAAVPKKTTPTAQRQYYQVKKGDTFYAISKKYGLSVDELLRLNKLSKNSPLHPGQKLIVK